MAATLQHRRVYRSPAVTVADVRCCASRGGCSAEEQNSSNSIAIVRSGVFVQHIRGEVVVADAGHAVLFNRGDTYRVSHPGCDGDRCTVLALAPGVLAEVVGAVVPSAQEHPAAPFPATHVPCLPRAYAAQRCVLNAAAECPDGDPTVDECVLGLAADLLAPLSQRTAHQPGRAHTRRAHRDLVDGVRVVISGSFRARLQLSEIASLVHSSPFHLARVFRRETGLTIGGYLARVRLRHALEEAAESSIDLTSLAHRCGFYDHSHFTNAFRREFGLTPSAWRAGATRRGLLEMSNRLQV